MNTVMRVWLRSLESWSMILIYVSGIAVIILGYLIAHACSLCYCRVVSVISTQDSMHVYAQRLMYESITNNLRDTQVEESLSVAWHITGSEPYGPQSRARVTARRSPRAVRRGIKTVQAQSTYTAVVTPEEHDVIIGHRSVPFSWPLKPGSFWISSHFGPRSRPDGSPGFHFGVDLAAIKGTPIYAPRTGKVIHAGFDSGYGKTIVVSHGKQFKTRYAHLNSLLVKTGDTITRGMRIGTVGNTGYIRRKGGDGSHLHFEVYHRGKRIDPLQFLPDLVS